jgi:hypothetical protein
MIRALIAASIFSVLSLNFSSARPMTCGQLKDYLENKKVDLSFDPGAELLGVVATHRELCIPPGVPLGTLRAVFIHWGDQNPKLMNMPSWDCIDRAFRESFQCNR